MLVLLLFTPWLLKYNCSAQPLNSDQINASSTVLLSLFLTHTSTFWLIYTQCVTCTSEFRPFFLTVPSSWFNGRLPVFKFLVYIFVCESDMYEGFVGPYCSARLVRFCAAFLRQLLKLHLNFVSLLRPIMLNHGQLKEEITVSIFSWLLKQKLNCDLWISEAHLSVPIIHNVAI